MVNLYLSFSYESKTAFDVLINSKLSMQLSKAIRFPSTVNKIIRRSINPLFITEGGGASPFFLIEGKEAELPSLY